MLLLFGQVFRMKLYMVPAICFNGSESWEQSWEESFVLVRFLFISFKRFLLHWSQDLLFGFDLKILDIQHIWQLLYEHIQFEHIHMKDYTYYINIHH